MLLNLFAVSRTGANVMKEKHSFSFLRPRQTYRKVGTQSYRVFKLFGDSQLPKERSL